MIEVFENTIVRSVAEFIRRLDLVINYTKNINGSRVFFCSRAGLVLLNLINSYRKSRKNALLNPSLHILWVNRLIALRTNFKSENFISNINKIYPDPRSAFTGIFVGLIPYNEIKNILQKEKIDNWEKFSNILFKYENLFLEQKLLFSEQLNSEDFKNIFLVDCGWYCSTEKILSSSFNNLSFSSILFGCFDNKKNSNIGLMFNSDQISENEPASVFCTARHIIEIILEPPFESPLALIKDKKGIIKPLLSNPKQKIKTFPETGISGSIYRKLINCLQCPDDKIEQEYRSSKDDLFNFILNPSRKLLSEINNLQIGIDLGSDKSVSLAGNKRSFIDDVWPQAYISNNYIQEIAPEIQKSVTKFKNVVKVFEKPTVDIVTRTTGKLIFLERALLSVQRQTYKHYVHTIVIDGSELGPIMNKIKSTKVDLSKINIVHLHDNQGMEKASNEGIKNGSGKFILIHDDDDTLEKNFLSKTVDFLLSDNGSKYQGVVTIANHISESIELNGIKIHNKKIYNPSLANINLGDMVVENTYPPISFLYSRDAYNKIGEYNEKLPVLGDWEFNIRFLLKYDIGFLKENLANYHLRDVNNEVAFGNTVTAGVDKHSEYQAIVRNSFLRGNNNSLEGISSLAWLGKKINTTNLNSQNFQTTNKILSFPFYKSICLEVLLSQNIKLDTKEKIDVFNGDSALAIKNLIIKLGLKDKEMKSTSFSERNYLSKNHDIGLSIKKGIIRSGLQHWILYGYFEKRTY